MASPRARRTRATVYIKLSRQGLLSSILRIQPPPAGWIRLASWILAGYAAIVAICLVGGRFLLGDQDKMFGEKQLGTYAAVGVLVMSGVLCFRIRSRLRGTRLATFWLMFGILMCMTALDDLVRIHERIDRGIHKLMGWDPTNPLTDHIDDFIVLLYSIPAMLLALWHVKKLVQAAFAAHLIILAMAAFLVHVAMDVKGSPQWLEETVKLLAGTLLMLAFFAVRMDERLLASWRGEIDPR
jgi:peptidoglycan/LPS O-acetylase OafA/YrhL